MATAAVNGGQSLPSKTRRLSISEEKDQDSSPNFEKVPCECSDFPNTRSHNGKKKGSTAGRQRRSVRIPCSEAVSVRCRGLQRCLRSVCPRSSLWLYGDEESERSWEPGLSLLLLLPLYLSHPLPLSLSLFVCLAQSLNPGQECEWLCRQASRQAGLFQEQAVTPPNSTSSTNTNALLPRSAIHVCYPAEKKFLKSVVFSATDLDYYVASWNRF